MSAVEIRCPRCGAQCSLKNQIENEYGCERCGATFRIKDLPSETLARKESSNCPACGRPVKIGEGYVCMECKKESLCSNCVQEVAGKFFCKECIKQKGFVVGPLRACPRCNGRLTYISQNNGWYCYNCKIYVTHICPKCGATATYVPEYERWYCNNCKAYLAYTCSKCKGPLTYIPEYQRWYCYQCQKYE